MTGRIPPCRECGGPGPAERHLACRIDALERSVRYLIRKLKSNN